MRWFAIDDPSCAALPEAVRDIGVSRESSELFVAAGLAALVDLADDEAEVVSLARRDGMAVVQRDQRAYVPAQWLATRFPAARDACERLATAATPLRRSDLQCVQAYSERIAASDDCDDTRIARWLDEQGFSRRQIIDVLRFTAIACGRRALAGHEVQFSPGYFELSAEGEVVRRGLVAENGLYAAAYAAAPAFAESVVKRLVLRSAEVRRYMEASSRGAVPDLVRLAPTIFFNAAPTREGMRRAGELVAAYLGR